MIPLQSQEQFEEFIGRNTTKKPDPIVIVKFGASWCGPCKKIDTTSLVNLSDKIKWYDCDIDTHDYTAGYCGIKTIPSFLAIVNGKPQPLFSNSDTQQVIEWIKRGFKQ
jgi:thioredoxin-like negative regulator of GroEL